MSRIDSAFNLFDSYNQQDPHKLIWDGIEYPAEYFYALQLYNWVQKLQPEASETLLLASRCQHIGRWKIPRETYLPGKAGYLKWRTDLAKFHSTIAGELLDQAGYTEEEIKNVQHIILKEDLRKDNEVQSMENALCLVFIQFQLEDFITKHEEGKLIRILQKTWKKMNDQGRKEVLSLGIHGKGKELIDKALGK